MVFWLHHWQSGGYPVMVRQGKGPTWPSLLLLKPVIPQGGLILVTVAIPDYCPKPSLQIPIIILDGYPEHSRVCCLPLRLLAASFLRVGKIKGFPFRIPIRSHLGLLLYWLLGMLHCFFEPQKLHSFFEPRKLLTWNNFKSYSNNLLEG